MADSFYKQIEELEIKLICQEIERFHGHVARAAYSLQMNRTTLVAKMKKYGLSGLHRTVSEPVPKVAFPKIRREDNQHVQVESKA